MLDDVSIKGHAAMKDFGWEVVVMMDGGVVEMES